MDRQDLIEKLQKIEHYSKVKHNCGYGQCALCTIQSLIEELIEELNPREAI